MRLTRTAIGLLTRQYRSVLRKCWMMNVGIWANVALKSAENVMNALKNVIKDSVLSKIWGFWDILSNRKKGSFLKFSRGFAFNINGRLMLKAKPSSSLGSEDMLASCLQPNASAADGSSGISFVRLFTNSLLFSTALSTSLLFVASAHAEATNSGVLCYNTSTGAVTYYPNTSTCTSGTRLASFGPSNASATVGDYSTALGHDAQATGNWSTALGHAARAYGDYSSAFGFYARVGTSSSSVANSISLGANSVTTQEKTISVGHLATDKIGYINDTTYDPTGTSNTTYGEDLFRRIINVADGINDHDVVTKKQMETAIAAAGGSANDSKITIKVNGTEKYFTTNQSSDATLDFGTVDISGKADLSGATFTGKVVFNATNGLSFGSESTVAKSISTTVGGGSDTTLATTSAVKAYADGLAVNYATAAQGAAADTAVQTISITRQEGEGTPTAIKSGTNVAITYYDKDTTYNNATADAAGLMSAADKIKLDGAITDVKVNGEVLTKNQGFVDIIIKESSANGKVSVNGKDVVIHGLADAAYKGVAADIATDNTDLVTSATVYNFLSNNYYTNVEFSMADRTKKLFSKECKVVNDNHKNVITRLDRSALKQHTVFSANSNDLVEILWSSHRMTGNATTRKAGKGSQRTIMKMYSIMAANENYQNVIVRSAKHNVTIFGRQSDNTAAIKRAA